MKFTYKQITVQNQYLINSNLKRVYLYQLLIHTDMYLHETAEQLFWRKNMFKKHYFFLPYTINLCTH